MKRNILVLIIVPVWFGLGGLPFAFAETIVLKSGLKFVAKILQRQEEYIIVEWEGQSVRYAASEIDHIEEEPALPEEKKKEGSAAVKPAKSPAAKNAAAEPARIAEYMNEASAIINSVNKKTAEKQALLSRLSTAGDMEKILTIATELRNTLQEYKQKLLALPVPAGCEEFSALTLKWCEVQEEIYNEIIKGDIQQSNLLAQQLVATFEEMRQEAARLTQEYGQ